MVEFYELVVEHGFTKSFLGVEFQTRERPVLQEDGRLTWEPQDTVCTLSDSDDIVLSIGVARLFHKDTFNRATGRKVAFRHALDNLYAKHGHPPHSFRKAIWDAYLVEFGRG